jgi:mono/diheme cytochrome c family protein
VSKPPWVIFGIFAAICVIGIPYLALAKEGGEDAGPIKVETWDEDGRDLFVTNCGPCHTLAAAGTDGVVGPNLDDQLAPGGTASFESSAQRAIGAVTCGFGDGRMPAGILRGENAQEVAAFVGAYAGQLSEDAEPLADTRDVDLPAPPASCGGEPAAAESGSG